MATKPPSPRIFMDPVHGSIELEEYLVAIIDTPEFQRLRKIKQLGGACYVYPGATHTRFEHSIGVCHIAGELIKGLNKPEKTWINKEEEMCIKIAALCHDIGHGPYSHLYDVAIGQYFDNLKTEKEKKEFTGGSLKLPNVASHEYRSAAIVKYLLNKIEIKKVIEQHMPDIGGGHYPIFVKLIMRMITFSEDFKEKTPSEKDVSVTTESGSSEEKSYLFEIVANAFTGIDVDKMDYFARDSRSVGFSNSFDWRRYTQSTLIIKSPDGDKFTHICSRDKDAAGLYELFHTRTVLWRTVYRHKTVIIIEHMIQEALIAANTKIKIKGKPLLECWKDMDTLDKEHPFFYLNDSFIEEIILTGAGTKSSILEVEKDISDAQEWFERIRERKLPKFFAHSLSCSEGKRCKRTLWVRDEASRIIGDTDKIIISKRAKFSYGKGKKNPMEKHYFYPKWQPDKPKCHNKDQVSAFLPEKFEETKFFWYYDSHEHKIDGTTDHLKELRKIEYFDCSCSID